MRHMRAIIAYTCIGFLSIFLSGCMVTDQFSSRIYSGNVNSQTAVDQETLLNIVRARNFQPLTFVAITKVAGSQLADIKIGLPTLTFGPRQTASQRQIAFANNSVEGNANGSFESNPLISSLFQQSMLTPISQRNLALLLGAYPREQVFYAALEGIKMTSENKSWYFRNDPRNNNYRGIQNEEVCRKLEIVSRNDVEHTRVVREYRPDYDYDCTFSQFVYYLQLALDFGLTAEIDNASSKPPSKLADGDASKLNNTAVSPAPPGYMCFDPTIALPMFKDPARSMKSRCGQVIAPGKGTKFNFGGTQYDIELKFRSPVGIYAYLGKLLRDGVEDQIRLRNDLEGSLESAKIVDIDFDTINCVNSASSLGALACNPTASTMNTLITIGLLEQLRNLSISPSDLNSSFAVRLSN